MNLVLYICFVIFNLIRHNMNDSCSMQGIDLFSGVGGMSIGAEESGVDIRYAVEIDNHAASTFALNHKQIKLLIDSAIK